MNQLRRLAIEHLADLGQEVFSLHEDLMRWRDPPLISPEKTFISNKLKSSLEKQKQWIDALLEE